MKALFLHCLSKKTQQNAANCPIKMIFSRMKRIKSVGNGIIA